MKTKARVSYVFLLLLMLGFNNIFSQNVNSLKVTKYTLENGLTVYLNEDHSEPKIFGKVAVKVGSKNDPEDNTGMAHYFEHIMFKGTDKIGTIDYQKEKVYLDSIALYYDKLFNIKDEKERSKILKKINELSIKSAEFAIPNETNKILQKYGSTGLNAYTSYEETVYHNTFPPEQMERWLTIYAERFRNPVFRLFQSELETVYEEQNMYADQMASELQKEIMRRLFPNAPYGREVIGYPEHLKNPSLTKMKEFYEKHYNSNNMALILSGDFDTEKIKPMIEATFGKLKKGEIPVYNKTKYKDRPFNESEIYNIRKMPIRFGMMAYNSVPVNHKDVYALDVATSFLSNWSETGLFDKMVNDNLAMEIGCESMQLNDEGKILIYIVPKVIGGKSPKELKEMVLVKIDSMKKGFFDNEMLEAIKLNEKKNFYRNLENASYRSNIMVKSFTSNFEWDEYLNYPTKIDQISKEDVVRVFNQYFTNNRLEIWNKTGFPKKGQKVVKPDFKPIPSRNTEKNSEFALSLENIKTSVPEPIFIDFTKDFNTLDIKEKVHLFSSKNPMNEIFTYNIVFGIGSDSDKLLNPAADLIQELGTNEKSNIDIKNELHKMGTSYNVYVNDNNFVVSITGFDKNLEKSIVTIFDLLKNVKPDQKQMDKLLQNIKTEEKLSKKDQNALNDAATEYIMYGEKSSYIDRLVYDDIKELNAEEITKSIQQIFNYESNIFYVGNIDIEKVKTITEENVPFSNNLLPKNISKKQVKEYKENYVFVLDNPKAIQSAINVIVMGNQPNKTEKLQSNLFTQYFGSGMSGLMFQELREFRSLAYGAYAYVKNPSNKNPEFKNYLYGNITTQSDKTNDAMKALDSLISFMPSRPDRIEILKQANRESINTGKPNFRSIPNQASNWLEEGYTEDPRKTNFNYIQNANFEDILNYYNQFIINRPKIYIITGNVKKFNIKELEKLGKVEILDEKAIRRF